MPKKLSERETIVLRVLLENMPSGSTGTDLVYGVRTLLGSISPLDVIPAGVHRTAASLCNKNLAFRAGTSKLQFYKITQPGRDVLDGKSTQWAVYEEPRMQERVRYVSPFGSPATMTRAAAMRHLAEDDRRWQDLLAAEAQGAGQQLSDSQRQTGPPHIQELPR